MAAILSCHLLGRRIQSFDRLASRRTLGEANDNGEKREHSDNAR